MVQQGHLCCAGHGPGSHFRAGPGKFLLELTLGGGFASGQLLEALGDLTGSGALALKDL